MLGRSVEIHYINTTGLDAVLFEDPSGMKGYYANPAGDEDEVSVTFLGLFE